MDSKAAKRVDGAYRNVKQMPLLGCLGVVIPPIGVFLLPIAFICHHLVSKLFRDYADGKLVIEDHDRVADQPGDLSTEEKLLYLEDAGTRMLVPYAVGTIWLLLVVVVVLSRR